MEKRNFVHLHTHSEFSLLDGAARISVMVKKAKSLGMPAVAISDHGNMYGTYRFYKECKKQGIKAIIGCEVYLVDDASVRNHKEHRSHFLLLAKDNEGYLNLCKLNSAAWIDGFYGKPRVDYALLKKHSKGLIATSACLGGHVPHYLMKGMWDEAVKYALKSKEIFGKDFYIELQDHGMSEQRDVNPLLIKLARELDIPLVATNDVHYTNEDDAEMQDTLMCVEMKKTADDPDRLKFPSNEFYFKTADQMWELFGDIAPDALENTLKIAEECNCHPFEFQNFLPIFKNPEGIDNSTYFRNQIEAGLIERYGEITPEIKERLEHEFAVINDNGFTDYFLIVADFMKFAQVQGIAVGPGRGSGAGSIIAYALDITKLDPFKYNLLFERFLHSERLSMPDFDLDFCFMRRNEVIEYVRQKYGESHVAQIITFGTLAAKAAIKDIARVFKMPYAEVDKITKPIQIPQTIRPPFLQHIFGLKEIQNPKDRTDWNELPETEQERLQDAHKKETAKRDKLRVNELVELYQSNTEVKKIVDMAIKVEGFPRNCSTHAAGVIVCNQVVGDVTPLQRNGEDITTQYDMKEMEQLGFLKMDFLGLITLTDIQMTLDQLGKNINFYSRDFSYDDPAVYNEIFTKADTDAIFQCETGGFKRFLQQLKPDSIEDIIAAVSLYRPGPMDMIPDYCRNKHNPKLTKYEHPMLEPILKTTYGQIVYQEQVMDIFRVMGGYSLGQADMVRRAMGKKDPKEMERQKAVFIYGDPKQNISGAMAKGVKKEVATNIFDKLDKFSGYAFNKSHAACYAYISYQTAYLKHYYYPYFMASVLNNRVHKWDDLTYYILSVQDRGTPILPPDINKSGVLFQVENENSIRFGLGALKNVGIAVIESILTERKENGEFRSFQDFCKRVDSAALNKRCLESLILAGAFDNLGAHRSQLMAHYPAVVNLVLGEKKMIDSGQLSLFGFMTETVQESDLPLPPTAPYDQQTKLQCEKDVTGLYLSGHPLQKFKDALGQFNFDSRALQGGEEDNGLQNNAPVTFGGIIVEVKRVKTKTTGADMAILTVEDLYGRIEVMLFPAVFERNRHLLEPNAILQIKGKLSIRDGESGIILADQLSLLSNEPNDTPSGSTAQTHQTLYLKYNVADEEMHGKVTGILDAYKGDIEVVVRNTANGNALKFDAKIRSCIAILNELGAVIGAENLKIV